MQQILQDLRHGRVFLQEVAAPRVRPGHVLVESSCSLISAGTERMLLDFGRAGWIAKARQQPEKVKQVLAKVRTDGLVPTIETVLNKLDQAMPLGYCNVGRVVEVGEGVQEFRTGDRVVSNGPHAEVVLVPKHLVARIPDEVSDEEASFTVLGAIALQGIRLVGPTLGETVALFGLGLIGQLAAQVLRAHGARVIGFDYDAGRVEVARKLMGQRGRTGPLERRQTGMSVPPTERQAGMSARPERGQAGMPALLDERQTGMSALLDGRQEGRSDARPQHGAAMFDLSQGMDPVGAAREFTRGIGVDAVLITASTRSDELVHQAAEMCRQRGRIVLTGVTGLNLRRDDFYKKELTFQVSCSYGPGRYDPAYEEQGHDYPLGLVRWTEQRNFEAVLDLMRDGRLETVPLLSGRFSIALAQAAYQAIVDRSAIGVLLTYPGAAAESPARLARVVRHFPERQRPGSAVIGLIGAGAFARQKILPGLQRAGARLKWVATAGGLSGADAARKFHIEQSTTEYRRILDDPEVGAVAIATRHNTHASLVVEALEAGKSVFVEKPLCLSRGELDQIEAACRRASALGAKRPILMVGYNRRFAPLVQSLRKLLAGRTQPLAMVFTCNAGAVPPSHWAQDPSVGGGRILGEMCHFVDLLHYLAGEAAIEHVEGMPMGNREPGNLLDTVALSLRMADGSLGQINYFANGPRDYPKERLEVFSEGRVLRVDNFRRLEVFGARGGRRTWRQDKGHDAELHAFVEAVANGGESPIPLESILETTRATLSAREVVEQTVVDRRDTPPQDGRQPNASSDAEASAA